MPGLSAFPTRGTARSLRLATPEDSARFGARLAAAVTGMNPGALLFFGPLGMGKTTLCRALVSALPGGREAEISSPSFTICNIYCTEPAVHHFDLYRLPNGMGDEALDESLDDASVLTLVEWSEHLSENDFPVDGAALRLSPGDGPESRMADLAALGPLGEKFLSCVFGQNP